MMNKKSAPLVSVVMPAYNASATIAESVWSLVNQTCADWELLVVDDGSTDSTVKELQQFLRDERVVLMRTESQGGAAMARNVALKRARGRYVAFLDSDDLWLPHKLERQLRFMQQQQAWLSFAAYKKISPDGVVGTQIIHVPPMVSYRDLLKTNHIGCLTAMYDRVRYGDVLMPEEVKGKEDFRFWLKLLKGRDALEGGCAHGLDEPLALYRCGHTSLSSNKKQAALNQWRTYRNFEELSLFSSAYYFMHYALRGFVKYKTV